MTTVDRFKRTQASPTRQRGPTGKSALGFGRGPIIPRWRVGLVFLVCVLAGCGRGGDVSRTAVHGEVSLDDQPVKFASLQFIPMGTTQGPRATAPVTDGRFDLPAKDGPAIGELRVEIRTDYGRVHPGEGPEQLATRYRGLPPEPIPAQYNRESVLKVTTEPGGNNFSFRLKSNGAK